MNQKIKGTVPQPGCGGGGTGTLPCAGCGPCSRALRRARALARTVHEPERSHACSLPRAGSSDAGSSLGTHSFLPPARARARTQSRTLSSPPQTGLSRLEHIHLLSCDVRTLNSAPAHSVQFSGFKVSQGCAPVSTISSRTYLPPQEKPYNY